MQSGTRITLKTESVGPRHDPYARDTLTVHRFGKDLEELGGETYPISRGYGGPTPISPQERLPNCKQNAAGIAQESID